MNSKVLISAGAVALAALASADASFNTSAKLQLTTVDLAAQNIRLSYTTSKPKLDGFNNGDASFSASGSVVWLVSTTTLNYTFNTAASGSATGIGTAYATATESQLIDFFNTGNVAQVITVNWNYTLSSTCAANNGSADTQSSVYGKPTSGFDPPPYFNVGARAFSPNQLTNTKSDSGTFTVNVDAGKMEGMYISVNSRGFCNSFANAGQAPAPAPAAALPFLAGLLRRRRQKR